MLQFHVYAYPAYPGWHRITTFISAAPAGVPPRRTAITPRMLLAALCLLACMGAARAQASLDAALKAEAQQAGFPALAAAVVHEGRLMAAGAAGTRRIGTNTPVTRNDRFHIGSDTKAMTSLLAAMMVEGGKLQWDSTLAQVFPELAAGMDDGVKRVTLSQLLSHTSGLPSDDADFDALLAKAVLQPGNLDDQRYWMVQQVATRPLAKEPGASFAYSNLGYTLVGAMVERVGGKSWEELMVERIFTPLRLTTAGMGPQATLGRIDAPLGHAMVDGKLKAMLSGPQGDNPLIIGPAGTVHMSVLDFARWGGWMAGQGKRAPFLVKPETLKKIMTPVISMSAASTASTTVSGAAQYALGWGSTKMAWTAYPVAFHGGSNGMNKAYIWVDTQRDAAVVVMTNVATPNTDDVMQKMAGKIYGRYVAATR
ncbi:MAG: serine hydrolase domain-containing protein [Pseudomonadota bacterium]